MTKLYTLLAVLAGIVIGAVIVYQRAGLNTESTPSPEPTAEVSPSPEPTAAQTAAPTPRPIVAPTQTPASTPSSTPELYGYTVLADDNGYQVKFRAGAYTSSSPIALPTGVDAAIMFIVSDQNVYYGGLEFRGGPVDTEPIPPGKSQTMFFTAPQADFTITAYWPSSGVVKYTIPVHVTTQ